MRGTAVKEKKAKGKGKGKEVDYEFKQINKAYELLSDPGKREMYLRTGIGWGKTSGFGGAGGGGGGWPSSPYSQSTTEYHFRRGRPYSGPRTGAYAYDWRSDPATWADPFNPHFRPHEAPRPGGMASNGAKAGWEGQGLFGRNGVIFLVLLGVTTLVTPLTAWGVGVEFGPAEDDGEGGGGGAWMPRVGDRSHADAAQNLMRARQEAREMGAEKMDAIRFVLSISFPILLCETDVPPCTGAESRSFVERRRSNSKRKRCTGNKRKCSISPFLPLLHHSLSRRLRPLHHRRLG